MNQVPQALFDTMDNIQSACFKDKPAYHLDDLTHAWRFLKSYTGSVGTFNSYRREVERLLHWCALVAGKTLRDLKRDDMENYVRFCQNPPKTWIGIKKAPKFILSEGLSVPNPQWRPFVVAISKEKHRQGFAPDPKDFELSQGAVKELFAIISSFYNYLLQEEYVNTNPVALIRQKSKFIQKNQGPVQIRRLTELQWHYVIKTIEHLADAD
ncbi:MAG TPA: site-specific integrase, partial [Gammaproteobacteria bacterium]|nr:site-specific integrase [Gammaproteobacteria bacterium]